MTTVLTPYVRGDAVRDPGGKRLWRKQLLPVGSITYKGKRVNFSHGYLTELAEAFNERAYDQVPFQLAPADNTHTDDPERYRGEVQRFEMTPGGLDIVVQATKAGDAILRDNPRLGISARIVEGLQRVDGKSWARAVQHVLGTLNPRITGMGPWQAIEASNGASGTTIDLTETEFVGADGGPAGTEHDEMPGLQLSDEQQERLKKLLDLPADQFERVLAGQAAADPTDAELDAMLAEIEAQEGPGDGDGDDDDEGDGDGEEPEPALAGAGAAELSATARHQLELANAALAENAAAVAAMRTEIDQDRWKGPGGEREQIIRLSHLPPSVVDLAAPLLIGAGRVVELSGGETVDAGAIVRRVFSEIGKLGKLVDLSGEIGQSVPIDLAAEDDAARTSERSAIVSTLLTGNYGLR